MKSGDIYYCEAVAGMSGGKPKARPVVIVTDTKDVMMDFPIYAVACTSTIYEHEKANAVEMPWSANGQAETGFRKPTWAMPEWLLQVKPSQLGGRIGRAPKDVLRRIVEMLPPDLPESDASNG